jgi:hypothetical protein
MENVKYIEISNLFKIKSYNTVRQLKMGGNIMKAKCNYAISPLLEVGKIYNIVFFNESTGFILLEDFPYNHFNMKYFDLIN